MNVTTIPPPRVAFIDQRTGTISREWYLFLLGFFNESTDTSVTDSVFSLQFMDNNGDSTAVTEADNLFSVFGGEAGQKTSLSDDEIKGQLAMLSNYNPPVVDNQALNWM